MRRSCSASFAVFAVGILATAIPAVAKSKIKDPKHATPTANAMPCRSPRARDDRRAEDRIDPAHVCRGSP